MARIFGLALLVLLVATPALTQILYAAKQLLSTSVKGVPQTEEPGQDKRYAPTVYKDYYSKTKVIITHPVSTVLVQEDEFYEIPTIDADEYYKPLYQVVQNYSTPVLQGSLSTTLYAPSAKYDQFEWATETQIFNPKDSNNVTVTRVVENEIPFL